MIVAGLGFVLGAAFGDKVFTVVEVVLGDPWDEVVFGFGGAAMASLLYELVTMNRK